jgi:hypothetical protein
MDQTDEDNLELIRKRLSDTAETGLSGPNSWRMMMMMTIEFLALVI